MTNAAPLPSIGLVLPAAEGALPGAFAVSGGEASLVSSRNLDAAAGAFSFTGEDATLTKDEPTGIAAAPIPPLSFLDLFVAGALRLVAEPGVFSSTRSDNASILATMLRRGVAIAAESGAFVWSVAPAERDMEVNGDVGAFNCYGQSASMLTTRALSCAAGSFLWTGVDSSGVYEQPGAKRLVADAGAFAWSGESSVRQMSMALSTGQFLVAPQDVTLDGPTWQDVTPTSGTWVYVTPSGGTWTEVDPDE